MDTTVINGFKNVGNTCFINSVLQCILQSKTFRMCIKNCIQDNTLSYELKKLLDLYLSTNKNIIVIGGFIKFLKKSKLNNYINGNQYCCHEFIIDIIDTIHEENKRNDTITWIPPDDYKQSCYANIYQQSINFFQKNINKSIITENITGVKLDVIKCNKCNNNRYSFNMFNCLTLPILDTDNTSLDVSIQNEFKQELIANLKCEKCDEHTSSQKNIFIWKLPSKCLIINLKRYNNSLNKINSYLNIPFVLKLEEYHTTFNKSDKIYNLTNIIAHTGMYNNGHYTTYNLIDNQWFFINDNKFEQIKLTDIDHTKTYMLFYES